jgi:FHS family L-fucose permease-like MFS transporter
MNASTVRFYRKILITSLTTMPLLQTGNISTVTSANARSYLIPIILVTSLFFLWGLAYGLLDVLNKHFQEALHVTKQKSTLLQAAYFGAYFLMALPAGILMNRVGYKKGILVGLILYAFGAFLFYPSAALQSFAFFLLAVFILASGLTFLETAANPYITVLGDSKTSEFRLNLSQSFNGVGSFIGPIIGANFFFSNSTITTDLTSVQNVYILIAAMVAMIAILFYFTALPEIREEAETTNKRPLKNLLRFEHFKWAVIAQFYCVAAQVGGAALFINYCTEASPLIGNEKASYLLSASLLLFTLGRFGGTALMKVIAPHNLLAIHALVNVLLSCIVSFSPSMFGIYCLMAIFFFNSIMFPTIFALGVKNLGPYTKSGASIIIMSIVGGAIVPFLMGSFAATALAYTVLILCYLVIFVFALLGYKQKESSKNFGWAGNLD